MQDFATRTDIYQQVAFLPYIFVALSLGHVGELEHARHVVDHPPHVAGHDQYVAECAHHVVEPALHSLTPITSHPYLI